MTQVTKSLYCIAMRNGVELWIEQDRARRLQEVLERLTQHMFVNFEDRTVNTADIVGVFGASDMEEHTRRKNGEWKCGVGEWHTKGQDCQCIPKEAQEKRNKADEEFYQANGFYPPR